MDIKETLFELTNSYGIGNVDSAAVCAQKLLEKYCKTTREFGLTVVGEMRGQSDYTIMLDAHIDEVGFIVTHISESGFVTAAKCGSVDIRHLPSKPVVIHSKEPVLGVFISRPPHLSKNDNEYEDISDIKIDTGLGKNAVKKIAVGDFITYKTEAALMSKDTITAKSLDDRTGVACLIEVARRLSGKELPVNVKFIFSDAEELGMRGAKTAAHRNMCDEAIAVDVSFADAPDIPADQCGKMGSGAMIGISPVLDRKIFNTLKTTATLHGIKYQTEVMGGRTSTNADAISLTAGGIKTGLISIPIRNMHTDVETVRIDDMLSVCDIIENYILSGGVMND